MKFLIRTSAKSLNSSLSYMSLQTLFCNMYSRLLTSKYSANIYLRTYYIASSTVFYMKFLIRTVLGNEQQSVDKLTCFGAWPFLFPSSWCKRSPFCPGPVPPATVWIPSHLTFTAVGPLWYHHSYPLRSLTFSLSWFSPVTLKHVQMKSSLYPISPSGCHPNFFPFITKIFEINCLCSWPASPPPFPCLRGYQDPPQQGGSTSFPGTRRIFNLSSNKYPRPRSDRTRTRPFNCV